MKIELVSHCYAGHLKQYAAHLTYQLSSLWRLKVEDDINVTATILYTGSDRLTLDTILWFRKQRPPAWLNFNPMPMKANDLFRRAIGREMACKATIADVVWFTDVDYLFMPGAFEAVCSNIGRSPLIFPRHLWFNRTHAIGDEYAARWTEPAFMEIDPADFQQERVRRAIGGVQIIQGDMARKVGYCRGNAKFQKPADRFVSCKCDMHARKAWGVGRGLGVDIPGVYRLRHTENGRDCR
jgi:hypothetical protein